MVVKGLAAVLAVLEHVADLPWVVLIHRLNIQVRKAKSGSDENTDLIHGPPERPLLEWVGGGCLTGDTLKDVHPTGAARHLHCFAQLNNNNNDHTFLIKHES